MILNNPFPFELPSLAFPLKNLGEQFNTGPLLLFQSRSNTQVPSSLINLFLLISPVPLLQPKRRKNCLPCREAVPRAQGASSVLKFPRTPTLRCGAPAGSFLMNSSQSLIP